MLDVPFCFYQAVKHSSNGIGGNYQPSNKRKCMTDKLVVQFHPLMAVHISPYHTLGWPLCR